MEIADPILYLGDDDDTPLVASTMPSEIKQRSAVPVVYGRRVLSNSALDDDDIAALAPPPLAGTRPPSRAASLHRARQAVAAIDRRKVRFENAIEETSREAESSVLSILKQKREYDDISKKYLSKSAIRDRIDAIDAYAMSDDDKAANFKKCFMKFAGVFGRFLQMSASSKNNEKSIIRTDLPREIETTVQGREGSTFLTADKGKVRWALVALSTMAGTKQILRQEASSLTDEFNMRDDEAMHAIESLDVSDVHERLSCLAGLYMDVREESVMGIGSDADSKNGPQLRYERWMRQRFSDGYFANMLANYAGYKVARKIRASVEIFMMETLYIVYVTLLSGVYSVSKINGEHGSLEVIIDDVRRQIRLLFHSALEQMQNRVSNSKYYRNMFFMCAAASAALVGIFIAIPNPPSLIGAITFIGGIAKDAAAEYADNIQGRARDANTAPIIDRISRFAVSAEFSAMFKVMVNDREGLVYAAALKDALLKKERWQYGGASGSAAHAILVAVVLLSAILA